VEDPDALLGRSFRDVNPGLSPSECGRVALLLGTGTSRARQVHLHLRPAENGEGGVQLWQFGYTRARVTASASAGLSVGGMDVTSQAIRLLERMEATEGDPLGGLSDMSGFRRALTEAIRRHRDGGRRPGVLLVDVSPAMDAGWPADLRARDLAMIAVSRRLRSSLREGDVVTRLDGHRFVVLCAEAGEVFPVADRVRESLTRLLVLGAGTDVPGPRMGTAAAISGEPADRLLGRVCSVMESAVAISGGSATTMAVSGGTRVVDLRDHPGDVSGGPGVSGSQDATPTGCACGRTTEGPAPDLHLTRAPVVAPAPATGELGNRISGPDPI
jgi:GGDEF domain-containing protein